MKKATSYILASFFCVFAFILPSQAQDSKGQIQVVSARGTVRDFLTDSPLENVSVTLQGTSIGTVTNAEGVFVLKIPAEYESSSLSLSHLGYLNTAIPVSHLTRSAVTVRILPVTGQLQESIVYAGDAREIVAGALWRIGENYPACPDMLSMFYRETLQKGHRYTSISEAMMDVYKTSYRSRMTMRDKIRLNKTRSVLSTRKRDTLSVKVSGGPALALNMDVVKNPDALFTLEDMDYYKFSQEGTVTIDDRQQFVISFTPEIELSQPLYVGRLFIDCESLAITRAEFSMDLSDIDKATYSILRKKPAGLNFKPLALDFIVAYRPHEDAFVLNYVRSTMKFRCDWKKRLFHSVYTTSSEMVTVDRDAATRKEIRQEETIKRNLIFNDMLMEYWSSDFWKDYNIIEPTESLENAARRLTNNRSE